MKAEFIAEIGGNHKGDFTLATKLVTEACESGSDVIKLQLCSVLVCIQSLRKKAI